MRPVLLLYQSHTEDITQTENLRTTSLMNINVKKP